VKILTRPILGQEYYLGSDRGGEGYFIKYCPSCNEKIYLEGEEFYTFIDRTYRNIPSKWMLLKRRLKHGIRLPKIKIEWGTVREKEVGAINERRELAGLLPIKGFDTKYFDLQYATSGGFNRLVEMIHDKESYAEIGRHFGFSREYARRVCRTIQEVVDN